MVNKDKMLYKKVLVIALPIALQNFMQSALNMLDVFMVGKLGDDAIAAVGSANQVFFLMTLLMFGINSGANVFTAQYWGKKDIISIKKVFGIALVLSFTGSLIFAVVSYFFPVEIIKIFRTEPHIVELGAEYLKIISVSYIFTALSFSVAVILRSMGRTKMPMYTSVLSFVINGLLNYVLIFGKFGFPEMGVAGSALATTIARGLEFLITFVVIYARKYEIAGKIRELFSFDYLYFKDFIKVSMPVIMNEMLWSLGMVMYYYIYSLIGKDAGAAVTIEQSIERMALVIFIGTASAAGVIVGNTIGEGGKDRAYDYAKKMTKLGVGFAVFTALILIVTGKFMLSFYEVSPEVRASAFYLTVGFAVYLPFKIFNFHNIIGVLRSGGDTTYAFILDITAMWLISIPLGFLAVLVLKMPVYIVFIVINMEEIIKGYLGYKRFKSKKWIKEV